MKGKIEKLTGSSGRIVYRIEYQNRYGKSPVPYWLFIEGEDMEEFMDDIDEDWNEISTKKLLEECEKTISEHKKEKNIKAEDLND